MRLEPEREIELASPGVGICRDDGSLLLLESSGTRIIRLSTGLEPLDTLPLTERLTAPAGVVADRFYIYVHDDKTLYRMSKEKLVLQAWLGNVRVAGLAGFEPGVMLVSDVERGRIWYKGLFGESRQFMSGADVPRPGPMTALAGGTFVALSAGSKLAFFNRSGIVLRMVPIPKGCDLLASDENGMLYLGQQGKPVVWVLERKGPGDRGTEGQSGGWRMASAYQLPDSTSPLSIAAVGDRLVVLDAGMRISTFRVLSDE